MCRFIFAQILSAAQHHIGCSGITEAGESLQIMILFDEIECD
jgi:hypothetical protein